MTQQLPAGRHLCTRQPAHRPAKTHCQTWPKHMSKEYGYEWCCCLRTDQQRHTVRLGQNICQRSMAMNDVAACAPTSRYTLSDLAKTYVKGVWLWMMLLPAHRPAKTHCQTWPKHMSKEYGYEWCCCLRTDQQRHTVRLGQNICQRSMAMNDALTSKYTLSDLAKTYVKGVWLWMMLLPAHRPAKTHCQTWPKHMSKEYGYEWCCCLRTDQQRHTVRLGQNICQRSMAMNDVAACALTSKDTLSDLAKTYVKGVWLWMMLLPAHRPAKTQSDLAKTYVKGVWLWMMLLPAHRPAKTHCQTWPKHMSKEYGYEWCCCLHTDQQRHTVRLGQNICQRSKAMNDVAACALTSRYTLSDLVMSTHQQTHTARHGQNVRQRSMAMSEWVHQRMAPYKSFYFIIMSDVATCTPTSKYTLPDLVKIYVKGTWLWVMSLSVHRPANTHC